MRDYDEKTCLCTLNRIFGYRPDILHGILDTLGSANELFRIGETGVKELLGPFSKIAPLISEKELEASEEELEMLEKCGCRFIGISEEGYPNLLKDCPDAPLGLYYKGCSHPEEVFDIRPQIAIVGTRDISLYGKEWCEKIVEALSKVQKKPLIVSGFALGTDIIAQGTALQEGTPTVAVLPTGIDAFYPNRNRKYVGPIANTPGCAFVTDYPPGTSPKAINFIRRNRIIAGMSSATILIESKIKGGGMITARLAASYDREVMVLPGRIDDPRSAGCNSLLREKLAEPITDLEAMVQVLGLGRSGVAIKERLEERIKRCFEGIIPDEDLAGMLEIAGWIRKRRGVTLDELCSLSGRSYSSISTMTGLMESEGLISLDLLQRCTIPTKII